MTRVVRRALVRLVVVVVLATSCQPAPVTSRPPETTGRAGIASPQPAGAVARDAAPTPANAATEGEDAPATSSSSWSLCDTGSGLCVGPDAGLVPMRVCETAAGVCQESGPSPLATTSTTGGGVPAALREAYDALLDNYVDQLQIDPLLTRALVATRREVTDRGGDPPPLTQLSFGGGRAAAWSAFSDRYSRLAALVPNSAAQQLAHAAIRAMAAGLNEGHTLFLDDREYAQQRAWLKGDFRYAGIGVQLAGSPPAIYEVFPDSPAERAGLRYGDRISATAGRSTDGMPLDEVTRTIRGEPGTSVRLIVSRPDGTERDLTVVREFVHVVFVEARALSGDVAYIRVRGFPDADVVDLVQDALLDARARQVSGLVLDLRGNGGGLIEAGTRTLSLFLDDRPAYAQVTRDARRIVRTETGRAHASAGIRLAVLVDGATASMGEIFAAALQDDHAGRVFGTTTAGSVAAGRLFPLSDGSALQVTVFRLETPAGRQLNGIGLQPDVVVDRTPLDVRLARDPPLDAALAYLTEAPRSQTAAAAGGSARKAQ